MQYHTILERSILAALPNIPRALVLLSREPKKPQCMAGDRLVTPAFRAVLFKRPSFQERHFGKFSKNN